MGNSCLSEGSEHTTAIPTSKQPPPINTIGSSRPLSVLREDIPRAATQRDSNDQVSGRTPGVDSYQQASDFLRREEEVDIMKEEPRVEEPSGSPKRKRKNRHKMKLELPPMDEEAGDTGVNRQSATIATGRPTLAQKEDAILSLSENHNNEKERYERLRTVGLAGWTTRMASCNKTSPPTIKQQRAGVHCNMCLRCDESSKYEGEKSKVVKHIYRKHVALDRVPLYCNTCKFVTTTQAELENHMDITVYPTHAATVNAMLSIGQVVSENNNLLQNTVFHVPGDSDMIRISREEFSDIFKGRQQRKSVADTSSTNGILRTGMMTSNIPVREKSVRTPSVATENILPELLGQTTLSPAPTIMNNIHVPVQADMWAPMQKHTSKVGKSDSSSSGSSSSSSSKSSSSMKRERKLEKEVVEIREATRTMATAMEGLLEEINGMRKEITAMREERRERNDNSGDRRRGEKENESDRRRTVNDGDRRRYEDAERRRRSDGSRDVLQSRRNIY